MWQFWLLFAIGVADETGQQERAKQLPLPVPSGAATETPPGRPILSQNSSQSLKPIVSQSGEKTRQPGPEIAPKNVFLSQYDRDRDGKLTLSELPEDLRRHFSKADRDGDGYLDADEILRARNAIGQRARRIENLKLGLQGRLRERRGTNGIDFSMIAGEWLRRMDLNGDGVVDDQEMREVLERPELLLKDVSSGRIAIPVPGRAAPPNGPTRNQTVPQPQRPTQQPKFLPPAPMPNGAPTAPIAAEPGRGGSSSVTPNPKPDAPPAPPQPDSIPDEIGPDGLPSVNTILKHLDKNHNDCVDRDEAIDQLKDHFNFLDKNKDGKLDRSELERSLKLARMFGGKAKGKR